MLVQPVIADHSSESPHDDFWPPVGFKMQQVREIPHLTVHVARLSDQHFAAGCNLRTKYERGTRFGRASDKFASKLKSQSGFKPNACSFGETSDLFEQLGTVLFE